MQETILIPASTKDRILTLVSDHSIADVIPPIDPNKPPVLPVGANKIITLPVNSVTLDGTGTDPEGKQLTYHWSQLSGPACVLSDTSKPILSIGEMTEGVYVFQLTATDPEGANTSVQSLITVKAAVVIPPSLGDPYYQTGYDVKADIVNEHNQLGLGSISTTVKKDGVGSFKSLVNQGSNVSSGYRSEVQYDSDLSPDNKDIVVEYDTLYEKLFNQDGLNVQWHGNYQGTSGIMSLWITGGKFAVQRNLTGASMGSNMIQGGPLMLVQLNRWYHMRWEIKFSTGSDGYVRLFIDGVLYFSVTGKSTDGKGQYLKIGTNRWNVNSESIVYFDNLKVWVK